MRLNTESIRQKCRERGEGLGGLLAKAGVSRTAYYSLARKDNILPASIRRIAKALGVCPGDVLVDEQKLADEMRKLAERAAQIAAQRKGASAENVRHALILLRHDPLERLRRALIRAA